MSTSAPDLSTDELAEAASVRAVLAAGSVRSVYQPIVDLTTGDVVAHEALARGPVGPLESPAALFGSARRAGLLSEVDEACRAAAFAGAASCGLIAPLTLFVNVEPEVLDGAPLSELLAIAAGAPGELRVVLEITERALASRPAELLRTVERVRELGWGVALDDVGVEAASLAFMSLLRPDVVKLDMSLVQGPASPETAAVMNAVNAQAERSGALILAEGIENEQHLAHALALGATLGQGWHFGRPTATPDVRLDVPAMLLQPHAARQEPAGSPFACLPADVALRRAPKRLLVELSKQLEREAMRLGDTCVVASTFQYRRHFTPSTALRYRDLVERTGFVCALGEGLPAEPIPGLRGATLEPDDAVVGEWDVVVLSPHFSTALLARDLGDSGPEMDRMFEYALTYRRETVSAAAYELLSRVAPRPKPAVGAATPGVPRHTTVTTVAELPFSSPLDPIGNALVRRALAAATSGVTISDMTRPDEPLIFINAAFELLAGASSQELLGRNCRLLQGPDTDHAAVSRIRAAVASGQECRELVLNYRGTEREPWWNEVHLSPVRDVHGRVVQYIGVQNDVTVRVEAERALVQERDRGRAYLDRIERLAYTDSLTGLMNRRRFEDRFEAALLEAQLSGRAVALLFMDLDHFKGVNDSLGHGVGDKLLKVTARRLQDRVRASDLLARLGGDEFLVALTGLDPAQALVEARAVASHLAQAVAEPLRLSGSEVRVESTIGISISPDDAHDFGKLLHVADLRMYAQKHAGGQEA